jgi:hypothetical protein
MKKLSALFNVQLQTNSSSAYESSTFTCSYSITNSTKHLENSEDLPTLPSLDPNKIDIVMKKIDKKNKSTKKISVNISESGSRYDIEEESKSLDETWLDGLDSKLNHLFQENCGLKSKFKDPLAYILKFLVSFIMAFMISDWVYEKLSSIQDLPEGTSIAILFPFYLGFYILVNYLFNLLTPTIENERFQKRRNTIIFSLVTVVLIPIIINLLT